MIHGSKTWPVRKEKLALACAEMRMVGWMCDIQHLDKYLNIELRDMLGSEDDNVLLLWQNRLR